MLEITRQADYALRAAVEVAHTPEGERISTATIAARQKIPLPFLAKIVSQLVVHGVLEAMRGASGGVRLARPAHTITMREIIEIIDGPITINLCVRDPQACDHSRTCALCEVFAETQTQLVQKLEAITLSDLVNRSDVLVTERVVSA
jgi:Rrf2 family transcriptional regulator, iron-sulfur cluster assembly transcription factor